jgi:hypothetical protein
MDIENIFNRPAIYVAEGFCTVSDVIDPLRKVDALHERISIQPGALKTINSHLLSLVPLFLGKHIPTPLTYNITRTNSQPRKSYTSLTCSSSTPSSHQQLFSQSEAFLAAQYSGQCSHRMLEIVQWTWREWARGE